ncbi:hypothetical protein BC833DRAFT_623025, partial [Globomyces pollinis-pini]
MFNLESSRLDPSHGIPIESLPMDVLYQIANWSNTEDLTQFSMASKHFLPLRMELFSKRKAFIIYNKPDLDTHSNFIKDNIQSVIVRAREVDLSSLTIFKNIQNLCVKFSLQSGDIVDGSPLASLITLKQLELVNYRIESLSPLVALINLKKLVLDRNRIMDISPLAALVKLEELDLQWNPIVDISPLATLINLKRLNLNENHILDISALGALVNLEVLHLGHTGI